VIRLAHFVSHPIQYFAPLYRELSRADGIGLTVLFGSDFGIRPSFDKGFGQAVQFDVPLLAGYRSRFLRNRGNGIPADGFRNFDCPDLERVLRDGAFDALWVHGWGYMANWQAMWAAWRLGLPYLVRCETTILSRPRRRWGALASRLLVRAALARASACLFVGRLNRSFHRAMGVPTYRLFPAHYSIETERFREPPGGRAKARAYRLDQGAGDGTFVLATCAKAIPLKRLQDPIRAVAGLTGDVQFWVIGEGPEKEALRRLADQVAPGRVRFLGFVNQTELPALLHACDAFVLSSESETWGLVVNEAMACGLPAVCSDRCGCFADLIRDGVTGYVYPAGDVAALAERLERLRAAPAAARRMGRAAQELVGRDYDVKTTAGQIAAAVRAVAAGRFEKGARIPKPEVSGLLTPGP